ncbi:MAG: hypothetical protein GC180_13055 [Bacteroidetes bacterium]|nr:hypothetical protein [Bacteroidota bacterium]
MTKVIILFLALCVSGTIGQRCYAQRISIEMGFASSYVPKYHKNFSPKFFPNLFALNYALGKELDLRLSYNFMNGKGSEKSPNIRYDLFELRHNVLTAGIYRLIELKRAKWRLAVGAGLSYRWGYEVQVDTMLPWKANGYTVYEGHFQKLHNQDLGIMTELRLSYTVTSCIFLSIYSDFRIFNTFDKHSSLAIENPPPYGTDIYHLSKVSIWNGVSAGFCW